MASDDQVDRSISPSAAISREIVKLHKKHFGRGPVSTKTYLHDDCVLVLMLNGHTPSEVALEHAGRERGVAQARVDISESVRREFIDVIAQHTGREVVGFMSSSQQEPSLLSHVYVLARSDLLDPDDA